MNTIASTSRRPDEAEQHYALGRAHKARNDLPAAESAYRQALRLRPDFVNAWISLGILLRSTGRSAEAETCQREALRLEPENFQAALGLGNSLLSQLRSAEAAEYLRLAVRLNPKSSKAHLSLGWALFDMTSHGEAAECFIDALRLDLAGTEAPDGLARSLSRIESLDSIVELLSTATEARPEAIGLWLSLAESRAAASQIGEAATLYEKALARMPADAEVRFQYSRFLLRSGNFAEGWKYYESRLAGEHGSVGIANRNALGRPQWRGEPLAGRTLFILGEQGIGDELMFASIFPEAIRDAGHCVIACDERLEPLFRRSFPTATIDGKLRGRQEGVRTLQQLRQFDCWIAAGSLPRLYRSSIERFPAHTGYVVADGARAAHWRTRLTALGPGRKIGLSWRGGSAGSAKAARRSLTLAQLRPVLTAPGAHFISLQYGDCTEELAAANAALDVPIHHWQEAIDDYDETAALVSELDIVVTVCTAVVHLAGALGRRVWVLAPLVPAAAYGWKGPSMPWYPQTRVFRQPAQDLWDPVITEIAQAIREPG